MEISEYKEIFKAESEEHLQQLNEALLGLEQNQMTWNISMICSALLIP